MSRNAIVSLIALAFSGAGLVGFAQMTGTSPPAATQAHAGEPTRLPLNFAARPMANDVAGEASGPAMVLPPASAMGQSRPEVTTTERSIGTTKITEFSRVASEYAQVAATDEPQATSGPATSVPLGSRRRNTFAAPAAAEPEPTPAPAAPSADVTSPSILKRPEPTTAALPPPAAAAPPAAAVAPPPAVNEVATEPTEEPAAPSSDVADDVRLSARRKPHAIFSEPTDGSQAPSIRDMSYRSVTPHLRLETRGPQALNLGKESRYYLDLFNEGETDSPEVQVRLVLPSSVKIEQLGSGATVHPDPAGQRIMWIVPRVEARGRETLELRLVATVAKGFDMAVDWAFRPAGFKAAVAVRQPQLQVAVTGPGEMAFGEEKSFRVTVSNVGTGDAESVSLQTSATGNREQKLDVGTLPAGAQKEFTVTFIANQPGELDIKTFAVGEGDLVAESSGKVLIRRAELVAAMTAPQLKYAGSQAIFAVAVGNAGNTPANEVQLSMTLPAGAKYVGGIEGAQATGNVVKWRAGQIPAGAERLFEATVELNTAGENKVEVQARGTGAGVAVATQASTMVEALADLKLVVDDQPGPIPAGTEVTYALKVHNRGSNVAKNIKVLMHFSEGIEPTAVDGVEARLVPGQVLCEPIAELGAGEELELKIKAKSETVGNHLYRIEVLCAEPETRLVSEGTTRFIPDNSSTRLSTRPSLFEKK